MAYNNGFPATYPQFYPQYQQPQYQQQAQVPQPQPSIPQQSNPMIWVQGETGAKSYLLSPNTTLPLWDSESKKIYLKSTDASGMPSMKVLNYTIEGEEREKTPFQEPYQYATKKDVADEIARLEQKIDKINGELALKENAQHSNQERSDD